MLLIDVEKEDAVGGAIAVGRRLQLVELQRVLEGRAGLFVELDGPGVGVITLLDGLFRALALQRTKDWMTPVPVGWGQPVEKAVDVAGSAGRREIQAWKAPSDLRAVRLAGARRAGTGTATHQIPSS